MPNLLLFQKKKKVNVTKAPFFAPALIEMHSGSRKWDQLSKTKDFWLALGAPLHHGQHHGKPVTKRYDEAYSTTGIQ